MKKKFLFWNIKRNISQNLNKIIKQIVVDYTIDVLIFAEFEQKSIDETSSKTNLTELLTELNTNTNQSFNLRFISGQKIVLLDNFQNSAFVDSKEDKRMSFCTYKINNEKLLISAVHLEDRHTFPVDTLNLLAMYHRKALDDYAIINDVKKVIVVGDFNLNPYESGIMGFSGFNAIFNKEEILYNTYGRKFSNETKSFYYNASWDAYKLNDINGTYHYDSNDLPLNPYWNLLDQVLFSPEIMNCYKEESFKIITDIPSLNIKLIKNRKNRSTGNLKTVIDKSYSDHLPIIFEVEI